MTSSFSYRGLRGVGALPVASLLLAMLFWLPGQSLAQETASSCESEPTDQTINYGDFVDCNFGTLVDSDRFRWDAAEGERVLVRTIELTGNVEPCFTLFDPMGVPEASSPCGFTQTVQALEIVLAKSGLYTMIVSDRGGNQVGNYRVALERVNPPSPTAQDTVGFDLTDGSTLDLLGDEDFFLFDVTGDETIRIEATELTGNIEPCLVLYGPTSVDPIPLVDSSPCGFVQTTQVIESQMLTAAGTYIVRVRDRGTNANGNYALTIECPFGSCSTGTERDYLDTTSLSDFGGSSEPEVAGLYLARDVQPDATIDDDVRVSVKDSSSGATLRDILVFASNWTPKGIARLPDLPGAASNGVDEVAVLAVNRLSGDVRVRIADANTKAFLNTIVFFGSAWEAKNVTTVPDLGGDGIPEIGVLATKKSDGTNALRIRDPITGASFPTVIFKK